MSSSFTPFIAPINSNRRQQEGREDERHEDGGFSVEGCIDDETFPCLLQRPRMDEIVGTVLHLNVPAVLSKGHTEPKYLQSYPTSIPASALVLAGTKIVLSPNSGTTMVG